MESQDHQAIRQAIRLLLAHVPSRVNAGSYDTAVAYKKAAALAVKVVNNPRATLAQLQSARTGLLSFS